MSHAGVADALHVAIRQKRFAAVGDAPAKVVLQQLEFSVQPKSFVVLFGPSGCGKSTLLNMIAGLDQDFDGRIERQGGGRTAFVFQEPRLLPWLTVEDNLRLVLGGVDSADAIISEWLQAMDLVDSRQVYPNRLSLGMARRVALARAFAIQPTLLLMDEPFVSLDEATAERLRELLLSTLRGHPATVVFVTHHLREAIALGDRLLVLGGTPTRLLQDFPISLSPEERRHADVLEQLRARFAAQAPPAIQPDGL